MEVEEVNTHSKRTAFVDGWGHLKRDTCRSKQGDPTPLEFHWRELWTTPYLLIYMTEITPAWSKFR